MVKRILVALDGSPCNRGAAALSLFLGKGFRAQLLGVHILDRRSLEGSLLQDISGALGITPYAQALERVRAVMEERGRLILEAFTTKSQEEGVSCESRMREGGISAELLAESHSVDLLVLAQHGEHASWSEGLLGSIAEVVVRRSVRPVIVAPAESESFERILLAYDGSPSSAKAMEAAVAWSKSLRMQLVALIVTHDEAKAASLQHEIEAYASGHRCSVEVQVREGHVEETILEVSREIPKPLLVMGAYGNSRLRELILGSTTAFVMRRTTSPLLLIR